MRVLNLCTLAIAAVTSTTVAQSTRGLYNLVSRRMPRLVGNFQFFITDPTDPYKWENDAYTVSANLLGQIVVEGTTLSALATGLHRYLTDVAHMNINWNTPSQLDISPFSLPRFFGTLKGTSRVPWRYFHNPVSFAYTSTFWTWEQWEAQLDWMALRGINLPLAWVGVEKIYIDMYREIGLTDDEISAYFSGPAFQPWNRLGNIQGSWGGAVSFAWIDDQFNLQKQIVQRMTELGMTPVLPSFSGYVPAAMARVYPNVSFVHGSRYVTPPMYSENTRLEPVESLFTQLQRNFISRQIEAYGNISNIYTLDLYNENNPITGDLGYLRNVTFNVWQSLKASNPAAVWLTQGWLFYENSTFWINDRVQAYLSGVENNDDMIVLDVFAETGPQWIRSNSFYGKRWIWCQSHDFGGNINLYGQIMNITVNAVEALSSPGPPIGFGMMPEAQETNEIVYDLLFDQAWSAMPIETQGYFHNWVTSRYSTSQTIPQEVYMAWETLRPTVYNNTNLNEAGTVPKSILEYSPGLALLLGQSSKHPKGIPYDPAIVVEAWNLMYNASKVEETLWQDPSFLYDMVDFTRQVLANAFNTPFYVDLVKCYFNTGCYSASEISAYGQKLLDILSSLDAVLLTNERFLVSSWIKSARATAAASTNNSITIVDFFEFNARNLITLWFPYGDGRINDYASKTWGGFVSSYYLNRWKMFVDYIVSTPPARYNPEVIRTQLLQYSDSWQTQKWGARPGEPDGTVGDTKQVIEQVYANWTSIFNSQ